MKNLLVLFLSIVSLNLVSAQDDPAKLAKSAGKALTSYNIDPAGNGAKLEEARTKIDEALKDAAVAMTYSAWQTKGEVYATITTRDLTKKQFDPNFVMTVENPAVEAFKGFSKALELATKKYEKSDAVKGLQEVCNSLSNVGVANYQAGNYPLAMESFESCLKANDLIVANGQKPVLAKVEDVNNTKYLAALAALQAKNQTKADMYFEELYAAKYPEPTVYETVFSAKLAAKKDEEAKAVLAEGRKAFPDDNGLMFAEINFYLKQNKLEELTGRLETAIAKEPNNVTLYTTLGNVYDNLYQDELGGVLDTDKQLGKDKKGRAVYISEKGREFYMNPTNSRVHIDRKGVDVAQFDGEAENRATEYFDKANKYYSEALTKDDKNVDAIYSLGALYYNKAAVLTKTLNALPDDTKTETLRQYEALKTQIFALFDQSLPYFKRAESLDANDKNTLIALKEIFAKKDELELSIEFKKRLEMIEGGGKNPKSYYQN